MGLLSGHPNGINYGKKANWSPPLYRTITKTAESGAIVACPTMLAVEGPSRRRKLWLKRGMKKKLGALRETEFFRNNGRCSEMKAIRYEETNE